MFLALIIVVAGISGDGDIVIKDQWMRPGAKKMATALYFTIENNGSNADTLYSVSTEICKLVQIHETYSSGDLKGMREVDMIVIKPNSSFELKPGSHHIMVMRLVKDIAIGDESEFTLYFKKAGNIKITAKAIN